MEHQLVQVALNWDADADVWVATSQDIPGLVLESGSVDALIERLRYAVPELLELNTKQKAPLDLLVKSERHLRVPLDGRV